MLFRSVGASVGISIVTTMLDRRAQFHRSNLSAHLDPAAANMQAAIEGTRATLQAHYTLAGAYSYGGSTGNRSGAGLAQTYDKPLDKSEWGPNGPDERHRFVDIHVLVVIGHVDEQRNLQPVHPEERRAPVVDLGFLSGCAAEPIARIHQAALFFDALARQPLK